MSYEYIILGLTMYCIVIMGFISETENSPSLNNDQLPVVLSGGITMRNHPFHFSMSVGVLIVWVLFRQPC